MQILSLILPFYILPVLIQSRSLSLLGQVRGQVPVAKVKIHHQDHFLEYRTLAFYKMLNLQPSYHQGLRSLQALGTSVT